MDYLECTAPCGLDCWNCGLYQAHEDEDLSRTIAQKTGRPIEVCSCPGCRARQGTITLPGHGGPLQGLALH